MSQYLQLHLLTFYPPSNLNRDDLGRPKVATVGGTQRLRVSSQSLKRAWRTSEVFANAFAEKPLGIRTKDLGNQWVYQPLVKEGMSAEKADAYAKQVAGLFGKLKSGKTSKTEQESGADGEEESPKSKKKKGTGSAANDSSSRQIEQLVFVSTEEQNRIHALVKQIQAGKEPTELDYKSLLHSGHGTPDVALFGRMLASHTESNVEAAAQVAHAFSIHKVTVEDDYFTAVDDLNQGQEDMGASHIGLTEFGSALFYEYICINSSLLLENLDQQKDLAVKTLQAFTQASTQVAPSGKQNSFASRAWASYVLAEWGTSQPRSLAVSYLQALENSTNHPNLLTNAIEELEKTYAQLDRVYGLGAEKRYIMNVPKSQGNLKELLHFVGQIP